MKKEYGAIFLCSFNYALKYRDNCVEDKQSSFFFTLVNQHLPYIPLHESVVIVTEIKYLFLTFLILVDCSSFYTRNETTGIGTIARVQ